MKGVFLTLIGFLPLALGWLWGRVLAGVALGRGEEPDNAADAEWLECVGLEAPYQGPAFLEVFGHGEHLGWILQTEDTIRMLQVDGKTLEFDARSRFRLTPLSFRELTERASAYRDRLRGAAEHNAARALTLLKESEERRRGLRIAIGEALETLGATANPSPETAASQAHAAIMILTDAREKDDHDDMPF